MTFIKEGCVKFIFYNGRMALYLLASTVIFTNFLIRNKSSLCLDDRLGQFHNLICYPFNLYSKETTEEGSFLNALNQPMVFTRFIA